MFTVLLASLMVVHALIHLMGTAKGFGWAEIPSLGRAVSRPLTLFNDLCLFAPGALAGAPIIWEPVDGRRVRATFSNAGNTVRALLLFNDAAELVNFVSGDRGVLSADGTNVAKMRWSTPNGPYRAFGRHRLTGGSDVVWKAPAGSYSYIRFEVVAVEYNVGPT